MRILISGTSGLIGSAVAAQLESQGHGITRLVRRAPGLGQVRWDPDVGMIEAAQLEGFDGVVHLASMSWARRWTSGFKMQIRHNRLRTNSLLAEALAACTRRPRVLVCASGQGAYGSSGDQILTEDSPVGTDFLATLQRDGEAATAPASAAGIRVAHLRIPTVLGGPDLAAMAKNVRRIGNGQQWFSWIARDEMPGVVHHVLVTDAVSGPVNAASPNPVRYADLVAASARVLGRKPGAPVPAFLLRLALGEMADALILASRRLEPSKLLASGYRFHLPDLEGALRHELASASTSA